MSSTSRAQTCSPGAYGLGSNHHSTDENSYIGDEETTQAAFDDEGYFKTGDLAVLRDGEYIFAGRVNVDCEFCSCPLGNG